MKVTNNRSNNSNSALLILNVCFFNSWGVSQPERRSCSVVWWEGGGYFCTCTGRSVEHVFRSLKAGGKKLLAVWWYSSGYFCIFCRKASGWPDSWCWGASCLFASFRLWADSSTTKKNNMMECWGWVPERYILIVWWYSNRYVCIFCRLLLGWLLSFSILWALCMQ